MPALPLSRPGVLKRGWGLDARIALRPGPPNLSVAAWVSAGYGRFLLMLNRHMGTSHNYLGIELRQPVRHPRTCSPRQCIRYSHVVVGGLPRRLTPACGRPDREARQSVGGGAGAAPAGHIHARQRHGVPGEHPLHLPGEHAVTGGEGAAMPAAPATLPPPYPPTSATL